MSQITITATAETLPNGGERMRAGNSPRRVKPLSPSALRGQSRTIVGSPWRAGPGSRQPGGLGSWRQSAVPGNLLASHGLAALSEFVG